MSQIYYTLRSATAVLIVYCNECKCECSFAYTGYHDKVAFWTKSKNKILCPDCALDNPTEIYRPVLSKHDLPHNRSESRYWITSYRDDIFCSEQEEIEELTSGIPKKVLCKCNSNDINCPNNPNLHLILEANTYSNTKFTICSDTIDCSGLISKLFSYNNINEFKNDQIVINGVTYIITEAQIMVEMKGYPWNERSLKELQMRMVKEIHNSTLSFEIRSQTNEDNSEQWVYIMPLPFQPLTPNEEDLEILFKTMTIDCYNDFVNQEIKKYPSVESDGTICGKKINKITAFGCTKERCQHNVHISFTDGSYLLFDYEVTVDILESKGYIPYIKQYRPKSKTLLNKQLECCELTKRVGESNLVLFQW